jgi:hypothetical protein
MRLRTGAGLSLVGLLSVLGTGALNARNLTEVKDAAAVKRPAAQQKPKTEKPWGLFTPSSEGDGGGAGNACTVCRVGPIACNETVTGTLAAGDCQLASDGSFFEVWELTITEPMLVDINYTSREFDCFLFFVDVACFVLATNDDCNPPALNSCLLDLNLQPGTYFLVANTFLGGETGRYALAVTCEPGTDFDLCTDCRLINDIRCGETAAGFFPTIPAESGCQQFGGQSLELVRFEVPAELDGSEVTIRLRSGSPGAEEFDTFLFLYDASCFPFAQNDDCIAGQFNLSCIRQTLAAGEYFIGISSFDTGETGNYELSVECGQPVNLCTECLVEVIECGMVVEQSYPRRTCELEHGGMVDLFPLTVPAELQVKINVTSTTPEMYDPLLFLYDSSCAEIARNNNCFPGRTDVACLIRTLPAGDYFIGVSTADAGQMGTYSLSVECEDVDYCRDCVIGPIACGQTIDGVIPTTDCQLEDASFLNLHSFSVAAAGEVTVNMRSPDFDTFLFLVDAGCFVVAFNDDCVPGQDLNSCITAQLQPGNYFLVANTFEPGATGSYTLEFSCGSQDFCTDCNRGAIECGGSVMGMLEAADCAVGGIFQDVYTFDLAAEDDVQIALTAPVLDPTVILYDAACNVIDMNDDCDASLNSCLNVHLAAGSYRIGAASALAGETGEYTLTVRCGPPGGGQVPGDSTQDARLDISDGIRLLGFLFLGNPVRLPCGNGSISDPANVALEDAGGNGAIELSDAVRLFVYLFLGGPPHVLGIRCVVIPGCENVCTP